MKNALIELEKKLVKLKDTSYYSIDKLMRKIMKKYNLTARKLHDAFISKNKTTPDTWVRTMLKEGKSDEIRRQIAYYYDLGSKVPYDTNTIPSPIENTAKYKEEQSKSRRKRRKQAISDIAKKHKKTEEIKDHFQSWVNSLLEDGFDILNYTWEGLFEIYCEEFDLYENLYSLGGKRIGWGGPYGNERRGFQGPPTPGTRTLPFRPATTTTPPGNRQYSSANLPTNQKIQKGMETWRLQKAAGDTKGASQTGKSIWAMSNPKLAARVNPNGTQMAQNPNSYMSRQAASLRASTDAFQKARASEIINKPGAVSALSPKPTPSVRRNQAPTRAAILQMNNSYDFGKTNQIVEDVAYLYQSIYEGNKIDQDMDGDEDFADVMIARMIASGMSKEEAIRRVKNKSYNKEEFEIDEETELERKKRKEDEINERRARVAELTASGRVMTSSRRASARARERRAEQRADKLERLATGVLSDVQGRPRRSSGAPMGSKAPEAKPEAPEATRRLNPGVKRDTLGKAADDVLKSISNRDAEVARRAQEVLKQMRNEEIELYDLVTNLLDEGYDLSDYTWDDIVEMYEDVQNELYEDVVEYLIDEGYVDNYETAEFVVENMSDEWLSEILESKKWIQQAIKKPGALSKQLGVPEEQNIPLKKLRAAAKKGGKLGKRARLAQTLRKFK